MADGSTPTGIDNSQQFSAGEAILAHGEIKKVLAPKDAVKHQRGVDRAKAVKAKISETGKNSLAEIVKLRGKESFDTTTHTVLKDSFKGDVEHPDHAKRAEVAVNVTTSFLVYTKVEAAARAANLSTPDANILAINGISAKDYQTMRNVSLDHMASLPIIKESIGDELDSYSKNPDQQRKILEVALAQDPSFRKRIDKAMASYAEEAKKLPPVEVTNPDTIAAREKIAGADSDTKFARQQIADWLVRLSPGITEKEVITVLTSVDNSLRFGTDAGTDVALQAIRQELCKRNGAVDTILQQSNTKNTISQLEEDIKKAQTDLGKVDTAKSIITRFIPGGLIKGPADVEVLRERLTQEKEKLTKQNEAIVAIKDPDERAQAQDKFNQIMALTMRDSEGNLSSPLGQEVKSLIDANQTKIDGRRELQRALTSGEKAQLATRAIAEAELLTKMENVMADALEQTILERNAVLSEIVTTNQTKTIEESMNKWSYWDNDKNKFVKDRSAINADLGIVMEYGDEAVRRMILRDIMKAEGTTIKIDKDGKEIHRTWSTVDLNTELPDSIKASLDAMEAQFGDKYASKLLSDYVASRSWHDISLNLPFGTAISTKNTLSDSQLERLYDVLGDRLDSLDKSTGGEREKKMEELRKAGINPHSKKGKTLLMLLLGGLVVGGVAAAVGAGVAATSVATAATV